MSLDEERVLESTLRAFPKPKKTKKEGDQSGNPDLRAPTRSRTSPKEKPIRKHTGKKMTKISTIDLLPSPSHATRKISEIMDDL